MRELPPISARRNALDRFDRYGSERTFQIVWFLLVALMILFAWGFVQLADFSNRVHVLIFWSILSGYGPMIAGLGLLWGHVSQSTRLVLKALDLSTRRAAGEPARGPGPLGLGSEG